MDDLISLQKAIEVIDAVFPVDPMKSEYAQGVACGAALAKTYVKQLPTAQPEIIRCRDCRYYEWMSNRVPDEQTWFCHNWNAETGKDDYCSYAERREG